MDLLSIFYRLLILIVISGTFAFSFPRDFDEDDSKLNSLTVYENEDTKQLNSTEGNKTLKRNTRQAYRSKKRKWKKGIVPYVFNENVIGKMKKFIREAMKVFHNKTCVRFVKRTDEPQYLMFTNNPEKGCLTTVGRPVGVEYSTSNLPDEGCMNRGIVLHELMHVLGFIHEHQRPDRDDHVTILKRNIRNRDKVKVNFQKFSWKKVRLLSPYSFETIMHYQLDILAKNMTLRTIEPLRGEKVKINVVTAQTLPKVDIDRINKHYGCK